MAAGYNFTDSGKFKRAMFRGETFVRSLTYKNDDNTPVDLTGYTATMMIREDLDSAVVAMEISTNNGRITLGGAAGTIDIEVSSTDTDQMAEGTYVYDLVIEDGSSVVTRLLEGTLEVKKAVTR